MGARVMGEPPPAAVRRVQTLARLARAIPPGLAAEAIPYIDEHRLVDPYCAVKTLDGRPLPGWWGRPGPAEPQVFSRRKGAVRPPEDAVYVGRPTAWGNPFPVASPSSRSAYTDAVDRYAAWINAPQQAGLRARARRELRGKDLVCWCRSPGDPDPLPCHAVVLLEVANG